MQQEILKAVLSLLNNNAIFLTLQAGHPKIKQLLTKIQNAKLKALTSLYVLWVK